MPAAAVISTFVDTGPGEPRGENAGDGVPEEPPEPLDGGPDEPPEPLDGGPGGAYEEFPGSLAGEPASAVWAPAPIAGRYLIGEYLGESRLGRTYRAQDGDTDQDVEVTFLAAEAVADPADAAARLEELRNLRHLHLLPLLDWQLDPVAYLVYPAPPMRLQRFVESGAYLTPSQALLIGLQAAETLDSLRQHGVTHGAINPANCCVDLRGRLRLAEMGLEFLRRPLQRSEATHYDAPETIRAVDHGTSVAADSAADADSDWAPRAPDALDAPEPPAVDATDFDVSGELGDAWPGLDSDESDEDAPPAVISGAGSDDWPAGAEVGTGEVPATATGAEPAEVPDGAAEPATVQTPVADPGEFPTPDHDPHAVAAAADVYGLAVVLAEAVAGQPVAPADIGQLGRSVAPASAGTGRARNLARLAPLLAQASAPRPENRLEADEFALALRATAEMFPPPTRLDEAFRRVEGFKAEPAVPETGETATTAQLSQRRNRLSRLVAAAVIVAGVLLVILSVPGDDTPAHVVPGVVGMDWSEASESLTASGWEVRRLEVRVPGVAPGEVVGQLPEPGGLLDEGQVVKVQVTLGEPLVVIPADVVGMTVEEAGLRLSAIGLGVGDVQTRVDLAVPAGSVIAVAEILPELPRGSTVDLVVAVGG